MASAKKQIVEEQPAIEVFTTLNNGFKTTFSYPGLPDKHIHLRKDERYKPTTKQESDFLLRLRDKNRMDVALWSDRPVTPTEKDLIGENKELASYNAQLLAEKEEMAARLAKYESLGVD